MAKASKLELTESEKNFLESLVRSRTEQAQIVQRARVLLLKAAGISIDAIAEKVGINRKSVMLCIGKYKDNGVENALHDAPGRGRNPEIMDEEKAWIINIACAFYYDVEIIAVITFFAVERLILQTLEKWRFIEKKA